MTLKERYSRQTVLPEIGELGQRKLDDSHIAIIGCGALGTTIADTLARAGIGHLTVVDRDLVEATNLQRQTLFTETDVGRPKAAAAAEHLQTINSEITVNAIVDDVHSQNVEAIIKSMDVVVDGTDNMATRFLINDACVKHNIPWVYGSAIQTYGMTMSIVPQDTACLRCLFRHPPPAGSIPTCDTIGVLNTIPTIIGCMESTEAIQILLGEDVSQHLVIYDVWSNQFDLVKVEKRKDCECCGNHDFAFLQRRTEEIISLCGSNAVQITPAVKGKISFDKLEKKLQKVGSVDKGEIVLKFSPPGYEFNIFQNGRAIIYGTSDETVARSLYAKYVGL